MKHHFTEIIVIIKNIMSETLTPEKQLPTIQTVTKNTQKEVLYRNFWMSNECS